MNDDYMNIPRTHARIALSGVSRPVGTGGGAGARPPFFRVDNLSDVDYSINMICSRSITQTVHCQCRAVTPLLQFRNFSRGSPGPPPPKRGRRGSKPPGPFKMMASPPPIQNAGYEPVSAFQDFRGKVPDLLTCF